MKADSGMITIISVNSNVKVNCYNKFMEISRKKSETPQNVDGPK